LEAGSANKRRIRAGRTVYSNLIAAGTLSANKRAFPASTLSKTTKLIKYQLICGRIEPNQGCKKIHAHLRS
jgi:hypothetical protein